MATTKNEAQSWAQFAAFGKHGVFTPNRPASRWSHVVEDDHEADDVPEVTMTREELLEVAEKHRPPQSWHDEDCDF